MTYETRTFDATLDRVLDGDTFVFVIDLGFYVQYRPHVRARDWDAWEIHGEERPKGLVAAARAEALLKESGTVLLTVHKDERSFERWIADITLSDGRDMGKVMVEEGHAVWELR